MDTRKIHHENYEEHFKELWESFHSSKNLDIVSKGDDKISTSSVLLSICSKVLREATKDILRNRELDLEDKMVVILPDFSTDSIKSFVNYILGRTLTFESNKEEEDVLQLLEVLRFGNFTIAENREQEESMDVTNSLNTYLQNDFKAEQMDIDGDDPDWEVPKPVSDPIIKPRLRQILPKPMEKAKQDTKQMTVPILNKVKQRLIKTKLVSEEKKKTFRPPVKNEKNFKFSNWHHKAKRFKDDEKETLDNVECCDKDVTRLNAALEHLKDLTKDWQTPLDFMSREDNKFRCPICHIDRYNKKSQATSHVRKHIQEIHGNVTVCEICNNTLQYETNEQYMSHLFRHKKYQPDFELEMDDTEDYLKCDGCNLNVANLDDALYHLQDLCRDFKTFSFEEKRVFLKSGFKCPLCREHSFVKRSEVRFHLLIHVNEIHYNMTKCGICPRHNVFPSVEKYLKHLKRHKDREYQLQLRECPHCKKMFKQFSHTAHVKFCERRMNKEYILCEFCPYKSLDDNNLKLHIATQHQKEKLIKCDQCEKGFYFKSLLRKHVMKEHENKDVKHMCSKCGKDFCTTSTLANHMRLVHVGALTHKCTLCGAKFKSMEKIKRHAQLHTNINLFKCSVCTQEFKTQVQTRIHRGKEHNYKGEIVKMNPEALNLLYEKLIEKIDPEPGNCGESRQRTRNAQPFLG